MTFIGIAILLRLHKSAIESEQTVNTVLGDISFVEKFGYVPSEETDEDLRISTHLEYVENLLRHSDIAHLSPELREKKLHLLDLLREYRLAGVFPRNYDHQGTRVPCFIDRDGRICAVGYLIEQTAGREVAEGINREYQYEKLLAMNNPVIDHWVASSGLTKQECAMIQPWYGEPTVNVVPENHVSTGYGVSSAVLSGVNLSLSAINGIQIGKGATNRVAPIAGLVTGAAQITLGALGYPEEEKLWNDEPYTNVGQRNVSLINISLGTATMLLSSWNLISNKPKSEKSVQWGLQSFQTPTNEAVFGFNVSKRF